MPPHSPELNLIENVFSFLKAHIKKLLRTKYYQQLLDSVKAECGIKTAIRETILHDALVDSIPVITKEKMTNLWKNMMVVFPRVFNKENI